MNFADIENTWRSPHNRPPAAQLEKQKMEFVADLRRRRRGNLIFLGLILSLLLFMTGKVVLQVIWSDPALNRVDLAREWAIIPFFALPWIGWLLMVRLHWRHHVRHPHSDASISASVAALLDENRAERARYKFIAGLLVTSVLMLPIIVYQLMEVGKAGREIVIPALVIYPAYVVGMLIWSWFHHQRKLLPRKTELEALLKSYD
ncbi:hypothetical protein Verru16b_00382 [Lacunisphaera limnophila]|uniref:Uncharacterized protein n=1 Tax=Lacunisphaera limnophila TaxID=1838286 RepID=A0A1D8AR39_9BACT|nr:hypothetical protein [Lacunisphaera limnophila]AOS43339.1 hypothetical protein Verru16b_00382 [Lacunisphaera limnophila]